MTTATIEIVRDRGVGLIRLLPPNLLDMPTRTALRDAFIDLTSDAVIAAIVVSGSADVFLRGDVRLIADKRPHEIAAIGLDEYWRPIVACPKPVIAALAGAAWGAGCELALMCDMIVADPKATLAQPESRLGVMPGAGGMQRLVRTLGKQMTGYLVMTGRPLPASRGWQLGLICDMAPPGEVEPHALALARDLAAQPPRSLRAIKQALARGPDMPLEAAAARDHADWLAMFDTADQKEGMAAAIEGRTPRFTGR